MKSNLLDTDAEIVKRTKQINSFDYKKFKSLVQTEIIDKNDKYIYKQQYFKIQKKILFKKEDFFDLVDTLDYLSTIKFVHGDINRKNIIYTEFGFKIIDYEPSLFQIKHNISMPMITIPYVLKSDLANKKITLDTDKIGFFYFILRVNNAYSSTKIVELAKHLNHTVLNLGNLFNLTYIDILNNAYLYIHKNPQTLFLQEEKH